MKTAKESLSRVDQTNPRLFDRRDSYGWISIVLHWVAAAWVLATWIAGSSIRDQGDLAAVRLHTTIAGTGYILLWGRIIWRIYFRHPGPLPRQQGLFFEIGRYCHYGLLAAIGTMLLSGPVMVLSGANSIHVFRWSLRLLGRPIPKLEAMAFWAHSTTSVVVISLILVHVLGVAKHMFINKDGTFDKMMAPAKKS